MVLTHPRLTFFLTCTKWFTLLLANLLIWTLITAVSAGLYFSLTNNPILIAQYFLSSYLKMHDMGNVKVVIGTLSYTHTELKDIQFTTTQASHIGHIALDYSPDAVEQQHHIDSITVSNAQIHSFIDDGKLNFGTITDQLNALSKSNSTPSKTDKPWQIKHIIIKDSTLYIHGEDQTTTLPFNLTLEPFKSGFKGHLNIPSARLVLASYPLGEVGQLDIESNMKGAVDFISTNEGSQILASNFKSVREGSIKFTPSEQTKQAYAHQEQMQQLLKALSDYRFRTAQINLTTDKNRLVIASIKLKGTNPTMANGRDVNININLTGNVFDLFANTPYDVPPVVKSFIDSIGAAE